MPNKNIGESVAALLRVVLRVRDARRGWVSRQRRLDQQGGAASGRYFGLLVSMDRSER